MRFLLLVFVVAAAFVSEARAVEDFEPSIRNPFPRREMVQSHAAPARRVGGSGGYVVVRKGSVVSRSGYFFRARNDERYRVFFRSRSRCRGGRCG